MKFCVLRLSTAFLFCFASHLGLAATTNLVTIGDFFFSPKNLSITNGDTVQWRNNATFSAHDSTSSNSPPLWGSGSLAANGGTFLFRFTSSGLFPYHCQTHQLTHPDQNGTINVVAGPNVLPTVTITNPVNNATFTAPATFAVQASASDSDGSISQVQFFIGANVLGVDTTSPYSATANSVAAGNYTLSAIATDNSGGKATNSITIVVRPAPDAVTLDAALSADLFTFSFLSQTGYVYSVSNTVDFSNNAWQLLQTTNGTGGTITITDNKNNSQRFYKVTAQ